MNRQAGADSVEEDPASGLVDAETKVHLRTCIAKLSKNYREVILLRIDQNLTFEQISTRLGVPLGTVLTWMRRATEQLRKDMEP